MTPSRASDREEAFSAAVLASLSEAVVTADREGRIVFLNAAAEALYGLRSEDVAGRDVAETLVHEEAEAAHRAWQHGGHFVSRHRGADGTAFDAEVTLSPVQGADGTMLGMTAVVRDVTTRLAWEESAATLEAVVSSAAEGIIGVDALDIVRFFSPSAERIFGWSAEEVVGGTVWKLVAEHRQLEARDLKAELVRGRSVQRETVARRKGGAPVAVSVNANPIRGRDGAYGGAAITVLDLADRRRAQREAQHSRELLQRVIDHAPNVICFKEPDGRWRMVNRRGSEVLGRSPARILGRRDADIFPPDFAERSREEDRQVQRRGQPMTFETDLPLPGGGSALYVVTKFPVTGADGTPDGIGMIASDISEIRRGEADRKRLGAIVQSAWDAIIAKDTEGRITTWNPSAERMFGLPEEQALGRMYEDVAVAPEEQDLYRELYARVRAGATVEVRMSGRRADGTLFPTAVSAAPLAAPDGSYTGIVATVRDISARVEAELALRERAAQLERSNADLEAFAYAASHDLQEPLRSINLSAEVLLRATAERLDDDERMLLSEVEAAAARMADQVGALMEVARVSLGRAPEEPVPAALALDDAIGALVAAIHESGAQIELTSQLPSTMMPRVELALVLQNVLANAIKYRRPDLPPQIRVSGSEGEEHVEIRIADNGIGMSRRDLAHIFSIFGRAQEGVPGTGMGLAVTRRVLGRRGGSISATSPGIGQGSEFILTLPAGGG